MITCKQVSKALENRNYEDLTTPQKVMLRFHISFCVVCGKYNTQMMKMHQLSRCFSRQEHLNDDLSLTVEEKQALKASLAAADDAS